MATASLSTAYTKIHSKLKSGLPVLLDGGLGTELRSRGVTEVDNCEVWLIGGILERPDLVLDIHKEYINAGADIITAGSFRTNPTALSKLPKFAELSSALTRFVVEIALQARQTCITVNSIAIAGSITTLEDCFQPSLSRGRGCYAEHRDQIEKLTEAGCDFVLLESFSQIDEAIAAVEAARDLKVPAWLSFILAPNQEVPCLLDGTLVAEIPMRLGRCMPDAILFNCCQPEDVCRALPILKSSLPERYPIGGYPNIEHPDERHGESAPWIRRDELDVTQVVEFASKWLDAGALILGGCCGTGPADIRAMREIVR